MLKKPNINEQAAAFLDALFRYSISQNKRLTKSGDPDAAQDHFTMMTLHAKLRTVPSSFSSWQDYSENILNTAEAFRLHLKSGGYYGGPTVRSAIKEIRALLEWHKPQQTSPFSELSLHRNSR